MIAGDVEGPNELDRRFLLLEVKHAALDENSGVRAIYDRIVDSRLAKLVELAGLVANKCVRMFGKLLPVILSSVADPAQLLTHLQIARVRTILDTDAVVLGLVPDGCIGTGTRVLQFKFSLDEGVVQAWCTIKVCLVSERDLAILILVSYLLLVGVGILSCNHR